MLLFYFTVFFVVKISADLMDYCLERCTRNLALFCFYFFTTKIAKGFYDSRYNFQVTYGLSSSLFEIHETIKTKDFTLN